MKKFLMAGLIVGTFLSGNNFSKATEYNITQFSGNDNSIINRTTTFQNGDVLNFLNDIIMPSSITPLGASNLTINGNNNTLEGTLSSWGFVTTAGSNYTVNNLNFLNLQNHWGLSIQRSGVAFKNGGTLTVNGSSFMGGKIYDTGDGVAIFGDTNSSTTIIGSTFSNNTADMNVYGTVHAASNSVLDVSDSIFSNNVMGKDSNGAGIYVASESVANIDNTDFINNRINGEGSGSSGVNGAAIAASTSTTLNITNSEFTGNVVTGDSKGGAIYSEGDVNLTGSTITGNSARTGGGIYIDGGDLRLVDSTLSNNTAENSAGAFVSGNVYIEGSTISNNVASGDNGPVGGIFVFGDATVKDSTISNNTGKGLQVNGNLVVENSKFFGNTTDDNYSGGAAIYTNGNLSITGSEIYDNTAEDRGGAIYSNANIINIVDTTFDNNSTTDTDGGAILANSAYGGFNVSGSTFTRNSSTNNGGAIYSNSAINISDSTFSYNSGGAVYASGGPSVIESSQFDHNDGNVFYSNGSVSIKDTTFSDNTGTTSQSLITASSVSLDNVTISDNEMKSMIQSSGDVTIQNSLFENNNSTGNNGTITNYSNVSISHSNFNNNHSSVNGGVYDGYGAVNVSNSRLYKNSADESGGALAIKGNPGTITNVEFEENSAEVNGGAIFRGGADVTVTNSTFKNNTAKADGGAIYNSYSNLYINADNGLTSFTGNKANGVSNAIHLNSGTLYLNAGNNGTITFNDRISSTSTDNLININSGSTLTDGVVNLFEGVSNATINFYDGNLNIGKYNTDNIVFDNTYLNLIGGTTQITDSNFINNSYIKNTSENAVNIVNSEFRNNASDTSGGAIVNEGDGTIVPVMNVYNSTFDSNSAVESGGAIYNKMAELNVYNSVFTNNSTDDLSDYTYGGGSIYNEDGIVTISNSEFRNNTLGSFGGVILNKGVDANLSITDSLFIDNLSEDGSYGIISNSYGEVTIANSTFKNTGDMSLYDAIGIYNESGTVNISNSLFENMSSLVIQNEGYYDPTYLNISDSSFINNTHGSAIMNSGDLVISDSYFEGNISEYTEGGALANGGNVSLDNVDFVNNKSLTSCGGAIFNAGGVIDIKNSNFVNNSAIEGGAIFNQVGTVNIIADNASSIFADNDAGGTSAIYIESGTLNLNAGNNGIITFHDRIASYSTDNLININSGSTLTDGVVNLFDGVSTATINFYDGNLNIGKYSTDNIVFDNTYLNLIGGTTQITDSNFINNSYIKNTSENAVNIVNSEFRNNTSDTNGGAIVNEGNGTIVPVMNVYNSTFDSNSAQSGGAIYNKMAELNVYNSVFTNNTMTTYHGFDDGGGGSIFNENGILNIANSEFKNHVQEGTSGGVVLNYGADAVLSVTDSVFKDNGISYSSDVSTIQNHLGTASITNCEFSNSDSSDIYGWSVYNYDGTVTVDKSSFTNLKLSSVFTKANYGVRTDTTVTNSSFVNNNATGSSMIYSLGSQLSNLTIANSEFIDNSATASGAAVWKIGGSASVSNSIFARNKAINNVGGAVANGYGTMNIENSAFYQNEAERDGGAIYNYSNMTIENSMFLVNKAKGAGGAVTNAYGQMTVNDAMFMGNSSTELSGPNGISGGGAIYSDAATLTTVNDSIFFANTAVSNGGAISNFGYYEDEDYEEPSTTVVNNSSFAGNRSGSNGGAIYNAHGTTTVKNSTFYQNEADGLGGAIYNQSGTFNIIADNGLTSFEENKANGASSAIYLESGTLNLNAGNGGAIVLNDKIASQNKSTSVININATGGSVPASAPVDGQIFLNNSIENSTVKMYNGTLLLANDNLLNNNNLSLAGGTIDMINNSAGVMALSNLNLANGTTTNLQVDADLANLAIDRLTSSSAATGTGVINVSRINLLSDAKNDNIFLNFADPSISNQVTLGVDRALGKIYQYNIAYNSSSGQLNFSAPTGFNPSVLPSSVAASTGNYINQVNSYGQAFFNMDSFMLSPQFVRNEIKYANRYADASSQTMFSPLMQGDNNKGLWFRPYTTFEKVPLRDGPTVSNVAYGGFVGGDSPITSLGRGFDGNFTLYAGYNGSHQTYDGIGVYQNGGMLGATGTIYKGNFFSALTANVGASSGESSTMYGTDYFNMISAGLASKTGYNWELMRGKFILQPSFMMAYTYVKTFDYTNAAGVNISSDPLNAIQIMPGVKFIANMKNGLQPYLSVSMVWNIMDQTKFYANEVQLPQMSINPYLQYGIGVQKRLKDRFTGFAQAMITSGGRNGLGLQMGFRWAI